jgi:phage-related minor tail protein
VAGKIFETQFRLGAKISSSFPAAFRSVSDQMRRMEQVTRQLRSGMKSLEAAFNAGEMSAEDYQNSLQKLQNKLDQVYVAQKKLQALDAQQSRIQTQQGELAGKAATTTAAAAPIVGMLAGADAYANAQKQIRIQSNLTAQQQQTAWDVVRQTHLSGLGEDINSTAVAYGLMSDIIKNESASQQQAILQSALAIQKYWGEAPESTARAVHNMITNFDGLSKTKAMDIVTAGFKNGMNYAGDYLDTLYEYAPQFESMGYSAEQFYSILAAGKAAGAFNLDKVGDAVKEFNIRAKDGSSTTADGFAMIGLDAAKMASAIANGGEQGVGALNQTIQALQNMKDPVKRNQAGVALFGTQWEDLTEKVILNMNVTDKAAKTIEGASKKAVADSTATPSWTTLGRSIADTAATVGGVALPTFNQLASSMTTNAQAVSKFAEEHPGLTRAVTMGTTALIGMRLASIGGRFVWNQLKLTGLELKTAVLAVRNSQLLATGTTKGLTVAQKALNLVMGMNPYAKAAMLIMGLVTAGVALYKNWDTVRLKAAQMWRAITNAFKTGVNGAIDDINSLIRAVNNIPGVNIGYVDRLQVGPTNALGLAQHAAGGIFNSPHLGLVAEAGPEAIIPLNSSQRSFSLWEQAGQALGAGGGNGRGDTYQYNFTFHIKGDNRAEIEPLLKETEARFQKIVDKAIARNEQQRRRLSFA